MRREARLRKDPRHSHADSNQNGQPRRSRGNWRKRADISTFYFTRFLDDVTENNLWVQFKRWGDVREIFISKQQNRAGKRFGFVRFRGVSDVRALERQLDNLIIGGLKLYVNTPRYERRRRNHAHRSWEHGTRTTARRQGMVASTQRQGQHRRASMTYAQALRSNMAKSGPKQSLLEVGANGS